MWGLIDILVLFEHISQYVLTTWEEIKESARKYLGPSPYTKYLIFENDEVIPEGREHSKYAHASYYIPHEHQIVSPDSKHSYKRLPWISVQHSIGDHSVDVSDWMSDIRANTKITLVALLRLASQALNVHLPETDHAKIHVITRDGEEEEYTYSGKVVATNKIYPEIHRRITCPFDGDEEVEGMNAVM